MEKPRADAYAFQNYNRYQKKRTSQIGSQVILTVTEIKDWF